MCRELRVTDEATEVRPGSRTQLAGGGWRPSWIMSPLLPNLTYSDDDMSVNSASRK